jgi:hypothetical protein
MKRRRPGEKLKAILAALKINPDRTKKPFRSVGVAFATRNKAAHASTESILFTHRLKRNPEDMPLLPETKLQKLCVLRMAERVVPEIAEAIEIMHKAAGKEEEALWWHAESEWSSLPADEASL